MKFKIALITSIPLLLSQCSQNNPVGVSSTAPVEKNAAFYRNVSTTIRNVSYQGSSPMFVKNPGTTAVVPASYVDQSCQFRFIDLGGGLYSIKSMIPYTLGGSDYRFLSVHSDESVVADKMTNSTDAEKFLITTNDNGKTYFIRSQYNGKYLVRPSGIYASGTRYYHAWELYSGFDVSGAYKLANNTFQWNNVLLNDGNRLWPECIDTDPYTSSFVRISVNGQQYYYGYVSYILNFQSYSSPVTIKFEFSNDIVFKGFSQAWSLNVQ